MAGHAAPNPMHEVQDHDQGKWVLFEHLFDPEVAIPLPGFELFGHKFQLTKFMVLELIAAGLILAIFIPLARRAKDGSLPKGRWWNGFESLLTFIRNDIARPTMGEHDADVHVPFLWTLFLFILICNLLGLVPLMGSPTASIWVTGGLAICSFVMFHAAAIAKMGPLHYVKSLWPHIDIPYVGWAFSLGIFAIEFAGTFIKGGVLAVRLFANMFGGHMVLASIMLFIYTVGNIKGFSGAWVGVTVASVLGSVALSLLELFVAFLQAYVFTFLTALFMGMALHPEH